MAYLNEFPKWDSNGRNLDWLLEQYSTFEKRLQEIRDAFNDAVAKVYENENFYKNEVKNYLTLKGCQNNYFRLPFDQRVDLFFELMQNSPDYSIQSFNYLLKLF